MKLVMRFLCMFFMFGYMCSGTVAEATTYYVATNGSNSRTCAQAQSTSTPKLTLNNALTCLKAGDTLYVRGGSYDESLLVNLYNNNNGFPSGTSWNNKVRIAAYPGDSAVWLRPTSNRSGAGGTGRAVLIDATASYVEFDGINIDGSYLSGAECTFWVSTNNGYNPHHIRLQNAEVIAAPVAGAAVCLGGHTRIGATGSNELIGVTIHGGGVSGLCGYQCASYGIYVEGPNNLIDACDIYDTSGAGVHIYNGPGDGPDNNTVRNSRIHDITRTGSPDEVWGIVSVGRSNHIYNNVIYGINVGNSNQGNAAIMLSGAGYADVYNNTIYGNSGWGIVVGSSTPNTIIQNNISYNNRLGNYANYGAGTYQSNNLFTDPRFKNAGGRDFTLGSDSPAIDKGVYLGSILSDILGVSRPQGGGFDIGAYEYNSGGAPVVSTPAPAPPSSSGSSVSPDATRIPGAASITDSSLNVWTLGSGSEIFRNGVQAAGGYGYGIVWYQGNIYVLGDDYRYWRWTGTTWAYYGPSDPSGGASPSGGSGSGSGGGSGSGSGGGSSPTTSASGTRIPNVSSLLDNALNLWTLGSNYEILRNGSQVVGGYGYAILWYQNSIYVLGDDYNWWRFTGVTWAYYGPNAPG